MTIEEFFDFDPTLYVAELHALSDAQLQHQDIYNCRTRHGGAYSSFRGVMTAGLTCGVSLVAVPIGLRRREVATLRLALIHAELKKRGLEIHQETSRDRIAPFMMDWACALVGFGIATGAEGALIDAGHGAIMDANERAVDAAKGVVEQGVAMAGDRIVTEVEEKAKR